MMERRSLILGFLGVATAPFVSFVRMMRPKRKTAADIVKMMLKRNPLFYDELNALLAIELCATHDYGIDPACHLSDRIMMEVFKIKPPDRSAAWRKSVKALARKNQKERISDAENGLWGPITRDQENG